MGKKNKDANPSSPSSPSSRSSTGSATVVRPIVTENIIFKGIFLGGVFFNAAQRGIELEYRDGIWETIWMLLDHFFTAFFLIEMCISLWVLKRKYFSSVANCIDCGVVLAMIADNWVFSFVLDDGPDTGVLSIVRCLRLVVLLRLFKANAEIKLLLDGTLSALWSLVWLAILVGLVIYTGAVIFVTFIGRSEAYPPGEFDQHKYFGDLSNACVTGLNLALMSDADWSSVLRPVIKRQPLAAVGICAYVAISFIGILNAIIGVIVTRAGQAIRQAEADSQARLQQQKVLRAETLKDLVYNPDGNGETVATPEGIATAVMNEQLNRTLRALEFPQGFTAAELHCMLDKDGDCNMSKQEFDGSVRTLLASNDFQRHCLLMLSVAEHKRKLFEFRCGLDEQFEYMNSKIDSLPDKFAEMLADKFAEMPRNISVVQDQRAMVQLPSVQDQYAIVQDQYAMVQDQDAKIIPDSVAEDFIGLPYENQLSPPDIPGYINDDTELYPPLDSPGGMSFDQENHQKDVMAATTGGGFLRNDAQPPLDNDAEVSEALGVPQKSGDDTGANGLRQAARSDGFNNEILHPGIVNQRVMHSVDSPSTSPKHAQFEDELPAAESEQEMSPNAAGGDLPVDMDADPSNVPGQADTRPATSNSDIPGGEPHKRTPVKRRDIITTSVV